LLESTDQVALLVGSSHFTTAGLGLGSRGNLEINVAIAASLGAVEGGALAEFVPRGERIRLEDADWLPDTGDDQPEEPELPWGFEEAAIVPGKPMTLRLGLSRRRLPGWWRVEEPGGAVLADSSKWAEKGDEGELIVALPEGSLPFFLRVRWRDSGGEKSATWPVNVTDKVALPPPEELRDLPVHLLLQALASVRPLSEEIGEALERTNAAGSHADVLDPLARFSATGQLMRRARLASQAFAGMRTRLERPAANEEALDWRLQGPFGPRAIAEGLLKQAEEGGAVAGETSFLLAELALTLNRVDWTKAGRLFPGGAKVARAKGAAILAELHELRPVEAEDEALAAYVDRAFAEAAK